RADGRLLASGSKDGSLKLWDVESGKEVRALTGHQGGITSVEFSPDGQVLATAAWDGTIRLWDPTTGTAMRSIAVTHPGAIFYSRFSPDGRYLATANGNGTAYILRLAEPPPAQAGSDQ